MTGDRRESCDGRGGQCPGPCSSVCKNCSEGPGGKKSELWNLKERTRTCQSQAGHLFLVLAIVYSLPRCSGLESGPRSGSLSVNIHRGAALSPWHQLQRIHCEGHRGPESPVGNNGSISDSASTRAESFLKAKGAWIRCEPAGNHTPQHRSAADLPTPQRRQGPAGDSPLAQRLRDTHNP